MEPFGWYNRHSMVDPSQAPPPPPPMSDDWRSLAAQAKYLSSIAAVSATSAANASNAASTGGSASGSAAGDTPFEWGNRHNNISIEVINIITFIVY